MTFQGGKSVIFRYSGFVLALLAGVVIGFFGRGISAFNNQKTDCGELRESGYRLVSPLLDCEIAGDQSDNASLGSFRNKVREFIETDLNKAGVDNVSVYFREANNGRSFSINEKKQFRPASLLKVPLMMAILKEAESNPALLQKKVVYNKHDLEEIQNGISSKLEFGKAYSLDELLYRMIVYSDNVSYMLIKYSVDFEILKKTYEVLGMAGPYYRQETHDPGISLNDDFLISAREYASFFRVLYNASYLNKEMSEKALDYLSQTDFKDGLVAGLPENIKLNVAHKWGYNILDREGETQQFHDCGIVYYPENPYILCVMTSGRSPEYLDNAVREISGIVYKEFARRQHS